MKDPLTHWFQTFIGREPPNNRPRNPLTNAPVNQEDLEAFRLVIDSASNTETGQSSMLGKRDRSSSSGGGRKRKTLKKRVNKKKHTRRR
jgi:hypothetical protein